MPRYHDDTQEICDRLNADVESIIKRFWPNYVVQGDKALLTPRLKGKNKRVTSSFQVQLEGPNRGQWYRHSQNVGGWGLQLLYFGEKDRIPNGKDDNREAFRYAREHLGIQEQRQETPAEKAAREQRQEKERREREERQRKEEEKKERKRQYRAQTAKAICEQMVSIKGTLAERYLVEGRGIAPVSEWPWDPDGILGFIPDHEYEREAEWENGVKIKEGRRFPCLIARVQDAFGETIAVWQIFLHPTEPRKNDLVDEAKVGLGPAGGGAVRIGGINAHIGAAEGLESALGAWELESYRYPVWSMLSTGGVSSFEPPLEVERITGWPDGDKAVLTPSGKIMEPPGISHQRALQERMASAGIAMTINEMTRDGDSLDLLITKKRFEARMAGKEFDVAKQ
ncbi:conserved hypothetical protein [Mesorhizobium plurifarium]|uniref:DUF7146 domain-containing protein n=1 Tax=Mesorhizobium plurifarium TaxID=69974 RepID=A0A090EFV5_MESPL|nr:conserved hypothetical protein [Mesorhizobium plurifarium]